ncbi:MAG: diguanylate cyclase [Candidatus Eremiobacteraeota bacterium]|nr:diguanylate cyclase [Candidatus Eremiobacteraeota bacterium]
MSAEAPDLLFVTTQLLGSGEPLRGVIPALFAALTQHFGADGAALVLQNAGGHRVAYRLPESESALGRELETAAVSALAEPSVRNGIVAIPVRFGQSVVGAVSLARSSGELTQNDRHLLQTWASIFSLGLHQVSTNEELARLEAIAGRDQLTGIANRRAFDGRLRADFDASRAGHEPLSLAIVDIDYFKSYNDRYGHLAGDGALRRVAEVLQGSVHRPGDLVARYGGEEFVVVLPATPMPEAIAVLERMRSAIFDLRVAHEESGLGIVTVSAGVATTVDDDTDPSALLARADAELYRAKSEGRNRVAAPAYLSHSAPATHPGAGTHNVPPAQGGFVGRTAEVDALGRALERSRLVTVTGPGGCGKTRLALEVTRLQTDAFHDGVWYADVSSARDDEAIFGTLALLLNVQTRGTGPQGVVLDRLRNANALIVLDGCERTYAAARSAAETLLARTQRPTLLCLSREVLDVPGESVFRLLGLQPDEARDLFDRLANRERAAQIDPAAIDTLCKRIDYLPLGIELLAASTPPAGTVPIQSLDDAIVWSVGHLGGELRRKFFDLCVFEDGFTSAAAAAVADVRSADLDELEAKSLIVGRPGAARRYRLLDSVRDFASRTIEADMLEMLRGEHFAFYRSLAGAADADALEPERENVAAAFTYARTHRARSEMLEMANALTPFWLRRGHLVEGLHWLRAGIEREGSGDDAELALALRNAGRICRLLSEYDAARDYNERALAIWRSSGNIAAVANALNGLALIAHTVGDFDAAQRLYEESLDLARQLRDDLGAAMAVNNLGGLSMFRGEYAQAARRLNDAVARARALGHESLEALALNNLGELRFVEGRLDDALDLAQTSLRMRLVLNDRPGLAATWLLLGNVELSLGESAKAWQPIRESLLLYREIGDPRGLAISLLATARLLAAAERSDEGARLVARSDAVVRASGAPLFGAERFIRDRLANLPIREAGVSADFEAAFEEALATFR